MASSKAEGWGTRVDAGEVVVVVGDCHGLVLIAGVVRVTNEGSLPVIVEVRPGDSHVGTTMSDIDESVVVVLAMVQIRRKIHMIDPDPGRLLNSNRVAIGGRQDLGNFEVPDDYIGFIQDPEPNTFQGDSTIGTQEGSVRIDIDYLVPSEGSRENNRLDRISGNRRLEPSQGGNSSGGSTGTACGAPKRGIINDGIYGSGGFGGRAWRFIAPRVMFADDGANSPPNAGNFSLVVRTSTLAVDSDFCDGERYQPSDGSEEGDEALHC